MDEGKKILWRSLLLTILIFVVGILLNHLFDAFRISIIEDVMAVHEIDSEAYNVERFFTETFGGEKCEVMVARISDLKKEIRRVGEDLGSYSRYSFFRRKDYDYLKRKYFLLELRFLSLIEKLNKECGKPSAITPTESGRRRVGRCYGMWTPSSGGCSTGGRHRTPANPCRSW